MVLRATFDSWLHPHGTKKAHRLWNAMRLPVCQLQGAPPVAAAPSLLLLVAVVLEDLQPRFLAAAILCLGALEQP